MVPGRSTGGILQLLELIEEHPSEAARDFREKFHLPSSEVGLIVTYGEAILLTATLMRDPTSWLHAAVDGWAHPVSWNEIALYDLYDLELRSKLENQSEFRPYPRPWARKPRSRLTAKQALAVLKK